MQKINQKGFSLVELMVVVAIIGILAAIAVPNFQRFAAKSKQSEARSNLSAIYSANRAHYSEWSFFVGNWRHMGYAPVGDLRYRHGFTAEDGTRPANYPLAAGVVHLSSQTYCPVSVAPNTCAEIIVPVVAGALPAAAVTLTAFTAAAVGDLDGNATRYDTWTVDQEKTMNNTIPDFD